eukprot:4105675-Ditylum_brightwellii.AAC.1
MSKALIEQKSSWQDWEVTKTAMATLKSVVGLVVLSQTRTNKWLLTNAIDNLITIYIGCLKDSKTVLEAVAEQFTCIKNEHEPSEEQGKTGNT